MSEISLVSIIALLGWLILALSAYRSYQVDVSKTIRMALIWGCVFTGIAFVFSLVM